MKPALLPGSDSISPRKSGQRAFEQKDKDFPMTVTPWGRLLLTWTCESLKAILARGEGEDKEVEEGKKFQINKVFFVSPLPSVKLSVSL